MSIPKYIDPYQMARAEQTFSGGLNTAQLPRVSDLLVECNHANDVTLNLKIVMNASNNPIITGTISTTLKQTCQRCLEPFQTDLTTNVDVCIMASEEQSKQLPSEQEYVVIEDNSFYIHQWIEDEIVLALPIVSYHADDQDCHSLLTLVTNDEIDDKPTLNQQKPNPFHVLNQLKANKSAD